MADNEIETGMEIVRSGQGPNVPAVVASRAILQNVTSYSDSLGLNELTAALWQRKVPIALAGIVGLLLGLVTSRLTTPIYRARASFQIDGFSNDEFIREVSPIRVLPNSTPENYLQNEVKLLESETLAKRVADDLGDSADGQVRGMGKVSAYLRNHLNFFRSPRMTTEQRRIKNIQKALSVRTSLQSQVIELLYDAPDPRLAARGADTAVSEFINLNREAGWKSARDTTDWLNQQVADLKATLENSNRQLQNLARSANLVFAGNQGTLAQDRMRQVQELLAKAEADRAEKQSRYEAAVANSSYVTSDSAATDSLRQYETDLQSLRQQLAQLETLYTPTNYRIEKIKAQIEETERSIEDERKAIIGRLHMEYEAADGLEHLLSQANARQLKTVQEQMEQERNYEVKKSDVDATQRLYEAMLQRVKEAAAASALRTTNVRIIDAASVPLVPYSPNLALDMVIGFAIGALGVIGFVLVSEGSDKVRRPGESNLPNLPELGVIPSARGARAHKNPGQKWIGPSRCLGEPLVVDSFRSAMTSILFSVASNHAPEGAQTSGRVLVVTSIDAMEGKTTILTNLGIAAAERNQRILLVDADLRRPRLHELFDVPNQWGLTDLLRRADTVRRLYKMPSEPLTLPTDTPNLRVLPTGPIDSATLPSLYSSDLSVLLQRLRRDFDLILVDTPPIMLYADARVLGRASDGVLLVVRANTKSREELKAAHLKLEQDRISVLGTILNDWKMDASLARTYGRYYDQHHPRPA